MTTLATPDTRTAPYAWPTTLALHLVPGLLFVLGSAVLRPLVEHLNLPPSMGFTLAGLLLVTPFELAWLARRGRVEGGGVLESIAVAAGFRRKLTRRRLVLWVVAMVAVTALALVALSPVADLLDTHVFYWVPDWMRSSDEELGDFTLAVALSCLLINFVGDAVLSATVEELYYRGHLMVRVPAPAAVATLVSAALFAGTHLWEPELMVFVFVVQSVLGFVVRFTGSIQVAIGTHVAVNTLVTAATAVSLLS